MHPPQGRVSADLVIPLQIWLSFFYTHLASLSPPPCLNSDEREFVDELATGKTTLLSLNLYLYQSAVRPGPAMDILDSGGDDEQEFEQDQERESDLDDDNVCNHYYLDLLLLSSPADEC